jgi:hypothetical protein
MDAQASLLGPQLGREGLAEFVGLENRSKLEDRPSPGIG